MKHQTTIYLHNATKKRIEQACKLLRQPYTRFMEDAIKTKLETIEQKHFALKQTTNTPKKET